MVEREEKTADVLISGRKDRRNLSEEHVRKALPLIKQECKKQDQIIENYSGKGHEPMISARTESQQLQNLTVTKYTSA
jgi:uncharacterized protein YaaQ